MFTLKPQKRSNREVSFHRWSTSTSPRSALACTVMVTLASERDLPAIPVARAAMISPVKQMMRIGELARLGKVTPRTVRYYESLGLIPPGEREGTGQHRYPEQTLARLQKIDQLKTLGLSLEDIGKVIHLYFEDPTGRRAKIKVLEMLHSHLAETDKQLASLKQFRSELMEHIRRFERWLDEQAK